MSLDLLEDTAATLTLLPTVKSRPSAASVSFYKPSSNTAIATGSATIGAWGPLGLSGSPTSQTECTLASAGVIGAGDSVWLETADGWKGRVLVSEAIGAALTLESPPPGTLDASAVFYPLELSYGLTTADTATRDANYRSEWTVTSADGTITRHQQAHNVVRMQFSDAIDAYEVKRHISRTFPSIGANEDAHFFEEYARRAAGRVRQAIADSGVRAHLIGNPDQFKLSAGVAALRLEMSVDGLVPPGMEPLDYMREAEKAFQDAIRSALGALQWIDKNDDGVLQDREIKKPYAINMRRY